MSSIGIGPVRKVKWMISQGSARCDLAGFSLDAPQRPPSVSDPEKVCTRLVGAVDAGQCYLFFLWARAEPAADFEALLVRPSRRTFDASDAAFAEVTFEGDT